VLNACTSPSRSTVSGTALPRRPVVAGLDEFNEADQPISRPDRHTPSGWLHGATGIPSRCGGRRVPPNRSHVSTCPVTYGQGMQESLPIRILVALRDQRASDWQSLCSALGFSPRVDTRTMLLRQSLRQLASADLIELEDADIHPDYTAPVGRIGLTSHLGDVVGALGLSLSKLAKLQRPSAMIVQPTFGRTRLDGRKDVFVLMPFSSDMTPVYQDHIRKVAKQMRLSIARADDLFTTHSIMDDVWSSIASAKVIIADCTGRNPNVFYELGIAHAIGKPVVLIAQNSEDVPSDLRHIRYLKYALTPRGMSEFEAALARTLTETIADSDA
jgi:hypothetical protein